MNPPLPPLHLCPSVPEPLIPDGGVVLTSIALNSYTSAAFKATVAPASETNTAAVTFIILFFFIFNVISTYSCLNYSLRGHT